MNVKLILGFLDELSKNNTKEWFALHKGEYLLARSEFERNVALLIGNIATFDESIKHISVKDATYRFNRDTRFSPDKSPYKTHLGAYIAAHGKKALHGGYYVHLEKGACMLACGNYCLPTNVLNACRVEIMANIQSFRRCVESRQFVSFFGRVKDKGSVGFQAEKGFGLEHLKTAPVGFPKDYEFIKYLRLKDYCCWKRVPDDFFEREDWQEEAVKVFKAAKPMMDFVNNVIDDYE